VKQKLKGGLIVATAAAVTMAVLGKGCDAVVAHWPLSGTAPTVHPSIRAWDAGVRE